MDVKDAEKMKIGDRIEWKNGDLGTITDASYIGIAVRWDDGKMAIYQFAESTPWASLRPAPKPVTVVVTLTDAAMCLCNLDDRTLREEMKIPHPKGNVFTLDERQARRLHEEFEMRLSGGWCFDDDALGTARAHRTARAAMARIKIALAKAGVTP